jgi:hypothetical protein
MNLRAKNTKIFQMWNLYFSLMYVSLLESNRVANLNFNLAKLNRKEAQLPRFNAMIIFTLKLKGFIKTTLESFCFYFFQIKQKEPKGIQTESFREP